MYAEIIFETGAKSVVNYEEDYELRDFLVEHTKRAKAGEDGGPTGHPAERIKRVLLYDSHPADYAGNAVDASAITTLVNGMGETIDGNQLIAAVRDEMSPIYPLDQGRHESMYKQLETGELDLSFLEDANAA